MAELFLISMIVTLVILTIRSGRPVILETPVIIHRVGKYHITLAPQLNLAQTFIEQVAVELARLKLSESDTQIFAVYDEKICSAGEKMYLLAVTLRAGVAYFQAIMPKAILHDGDSHYQTMSAFATAVLHDIPLGDVEKTAPDLIERGLNTAAQQAHLTVIPQRAKSASEEGNVG